MDNSEAATPLIRIGVLSDTHGLLRPEVFSAFEGVDLLIHAGDVGKPGILEELRRIAPVHAVRGNVDHGDWARRLPATEVVQAGGVFIYVLHNIDLLDLHPPAAGFSAVVCGHSHRPETWRKDGVLYLNPGSCGPRRFRLPVTVAEMTVPVDGTAIVARWIEMMS